MSGGIFFILWKYVINPTSKDIIIDDNNGGNNDNHNDIYKTKGSELLLQLNNNSIASALILNVKTEDELSFFDYVKYDSINSIILPNNTYSFDEILFEKLYFFNYKCYNWFKSKNQPIYYNNLYKLNDIFSSMISDIFINDLSHQYSLSIYDLYSGELFYDKYNDIAGILFKSYSFPKANDINFYYSPCQNTSNINQFNYNEYIYRNLLYIYNFTNNDISLYKLNNYYNGYFNNNNFIKNYDNSISIDNFRWNGLPIDYGSLFYFNGKGLFVGN